MEKKSFLFFFFIYSSGQTEYRCFPSPEAAQPFRFTSPQCLSSKIKKINWERERERISQENKVGGAGGIITNVSIVASDRLMDCGLTKCVRFGGSTQFLAPNYYNTVDLFLIPFVFFLFFLPIAQSDPICRAEAAAQFAVWVQHRQKVDGSTHTHKKGARQTKVGFQGVDNSRRGVE